MELKGSKTEANLWIAFAGESQVRNKYDYYASKAKKEGYEQIAEIFLKTAESATSGGVADLAASVAALQQQVSEMTQSNAELQYQIDHSDDDDMRESVAREKLGLVNPGEKIFDDTSD